MNDLETAMTFFSEDAVYEPGDGKTHRGKAQIRAAFEPQFNYEYGKIRFDEVDRAIDIENRKAAFRWVCRHDISHARPRGLSKTFQKMIAGLSVGNRFGWQGVDVFHFDSEGLIRGKFTYGWYGSRPLIMRSLG